MNIEEPDGPDDNSFNIQVGGLKDPLPWVSSRLGLEKFEAIDCNFSTLSYDKILTCSKGLRELTLDPIIDIDQEKILAFYRE